MSFTVATIAMIAGSAIVAGGTIGQSRAINRGKGDREDEQAAAKIAMEREKEAFRNIQLNNPFADTKNYYEDVTNPYSNITVNQQEAQFQAQQGAQQRANIMQGLRGAAGGSGIAGLAQTLASQGALQSQQIAASIGKQEAANQKLIAKGQQTQELYEAKGAMAAQESIAAGEQWLTQMEADKQATLLGMEQQRLAAANQSLENDRLMRANMWGNIVKVGGSIASAGISASGE